MSKSQSLYGIKSIFGKGSREESSRVALTPYLPEKNKKKVAIITCPGSSYHWIDRRAENTDVAHWLQSRGIAAFVLKYRTVGIIPYLTHSRLFFRGVRQPDMSRDIQRAIQVVRERAQECRKWKEMFLSWL